MPVTTMPEPIVRLRPDGALARWSVRCGDREVILGIYASSDASFDIYVDAMALRPSGFAGGVARASIPYVTSVQAERIGLALAQRIASGKLHPLWQVRVCAAVAEILEVEKAR